MCASEPIRGVRLTAGVRPKVLCGGSVENLFGVRFEKVHIMKI